MTRIGGFSSPAEMRGKSTTQKHSGTGAIEGSAANSARAGSAASDHRQRSMSSMALPSAAEVPEHLIRADDQLASRGRAERIRDCTAGRWVARGVYARPIACQATARITPEPRAHRKPSAAERTSPPAAAAGETVYPEEQ